ncbi:MAG: NAD(P)-binding protein [Polyangia bacterium]
MTIFGAGISGLSAAHELVDRGFIVQVFEKEEERSCPGRTHIGGLAANQPARVRANIEDLHGRLIADALTIQPETATQAAQDRSAVAAWFLRVFAFNRSRWIRTETPARINGCIFSPSQSEAGAKFKIGLFSDLIEARNGYRQRWLWDLLVRGVILGAIRPKSRNVDALENAIKTFNELKNMRSPELEGALLTYESQNTTHALPKLEQLERQRDMTEAALEREFLCFRIIPYARRGFPEAGNHAMKLYDDWAAEFGKSADLRQNCLSCVAGELREVDEPREGLRRGRDGIPVTVREADASPEFVHTAWLQLEIIEQRLPGEHGYRFFPSFYRHLDDTMGRIPLYSNGRPTGRSVRDNLKPTVFQGIGLSRQDTQWIVEHSRGEKNNPRRAYLEDHDPRQVDNRYPDYDDPAARGCRDQTMGTVVELDRELPRSFEALRNCTDRFTHRVGGTGRDAVLLLAKLVRYLTASPERRRKEYEKVSWGEFLDSKKFSDVFRFHVHSAAQSLVAFSAAEADARTYGNIALQMMLDELRDGTRVDRTLNGPTNDAWLEPWREHLERQGVRFFRGELESLHLVKPAKENEEPELIPRVRINDKDFWSQSGADILSAGNPDAALRPDFYVLALNVEETRRLLSDLKKEAGEQVDFRKRAPDFQSTLDFGDVVEESGAMRNMTGIQYFFDAKTAIGRGHLYFPFSEWGLSSISQSEFWSARGGFADGYFGVLSVDVCTTKRQDHTNIAALPAPDLKLKAFADIIDPDNEGASCLAAARIALDQIKPRIGLRCALSEPRCFHVDRHSLTDKGPRFLASVVGLDDTRPGRPGDCVGEKEVEYSLNFDRWVLCGTFMATHTRMTTMEAANESARHAVATILRKLSTADAANVIEAEVEHQSYEIENLANKTYNWASENRGYEAPQTWNPEDYEIPDFDFFRRVDRRLLEMGIPHFMDVINFDRKLEHALDGVDIYGQERPLSEIFGLAAANLDAALTRELGPGYADLEGKRYQEGQRLTSSGRFPDLANMQDRLKELFDVFSSLIRPERIADVNRNHLRRK